MICAQEAKCHSGLKDAALVWLGDSPYLVSAGFNMTRDAELAIWDVSGGLSSPVSRLSLGSSSTGYICTPPLLSHLSNLDCFSIPVEAPCFSMITIPRCCS